LSLKTPGFNKNPELKDEIHCVAVLVDANHVASLNDEMKKQLMDIIKLCGRKGKRCLTFMNILLFKWFYGAFSCQIVQF